MLKINKDEVYVINQPKHIATYILVVGNEFPLLDSVHEKLGELNGVYDLLLVFSPDHFPAQKEIDYDKFASLYESCAWIVSGGDLGATIFKLLKYSREIFHHRTFLISNTSEVGNIEPDKLWKLVMSPIIKPVMEIGRLSTDELYDIYSKKELSWNLFSRTEDSRVNRYCSYRVESDVMFFRDTTIDVILDFFENIDPEFVRTFSSEDVRYMFGSMVKRLGLDYLDMDYNEVQV